MKRLKSFCKRVFILPLWLIIVLTIVSTSALVFVFLEGLHSFFYAYAVYGVSFYTFTVICIACFTTIPRYYRRIKGKVYENEYANRYLTDAAYKTHVSLYLSLGINLLYIGINGVSAVIYRTHWFAIFAIYYGIMAVMRFLLVRYVGKNQIGESRLGELKRSRACAYILMTVNITLSGVVLMMVYYNRGFQYQGYLIYVMALYTFYTTITAIIGAIRYRKYQSPVMSMSKIIKLSASLFSMLFLETAMFAQFGQGTPEQMKQLMIMATGAGICAIVVGMSLYMIVRSSKEIRNIKKAKRSNDIYADSK